VNEADERTVQVTALRLLARREHSSQELRRKLTGRGYPEATVDLVIERLADKKLVSNDRFVASFVHHHAMRGQGPLRIRSELRRQGIDDATITAEFERGEVGWAALAAQVLTRKFGTGGPADLSERAKRVRFLQYRGFSTDQIRAALASAPTTEAWGEASDLSAEPGIDSDLDS
jgi:regulatory protein